MRFTSKKKSREKVAAIIDEREIFVDAWCVCYENADPQVLGYIFDAAHHCGDENEDVIHNFFRRGYCYYFAHMLQLAFRRGTVCVAAPLGHFVWMDENQIPYDIEGVNESECEAYIPEEFMGDMVKDFLRVKGDYHNTTAEEIEDLIKCYRESHKSNN